MSENGQIKVSQTLKQCLENHNNYNSIILSVYTAAFSQSGSLSATSESDIGPATNTGEVPRLFSRSAVGCLFKSLVVGLVERLNFK